MRKYHRTKLPLGADNFLSILEGVEGGFAIFTGIIVGLSFSVLSRDLLLLTAGIGIIVNAFNSSAVRYATQHYEDELDGRESHDPFSRYFIPAFIEFTAYALVSAVVVLPLLVIQPIQAAILVCIFLTLFVLFGAGYYRGTLLRTHKIRDGLEVALLGGLIVMVGGIAGWILSYLVA
jgi:hypothetical protein